MLTLKSFGTLVLTLILVLVSTTAFAAIVPPEGYQIETIASYTSSGMGEVTDLVLDSSGVVYVAHRGNAATGFNNDGSITRIDSAGVDTYSVTNIDGVARMVWTGGTAYGDNLYMVERLNRTIHKIGSNGIFTPFSYISTAPIGLTVDRNGAYGGLMYSSSNGTDQIYSVSTSGVSSRFSSWPGVLSGGIVDLKISPTSKYNGSMFAALDENHSSVGDPRDGIYRIDTNGNSSTLSRLNHWI